jgi:hypothetical protein
MGLMELTLLAASTVLLAAMWIVLVTLAQARKAMLWNTGDFDAPPAGVASSQRQPPR